MSSFNPSSPASGRYTGSQERRIKREESVEDKGRGWEEREVRPRDRWVEEDRYEAKREFPRYGEEQRRQPADVGRWAEGGRVDDRGFAPWAQGPVAPMPAVYQQPTAVRPDASTALWTARPYHGGLRRDAQREAAVCRGCGGDHEQRDCPTRPVCERCKKWGHREETCRVSARDRRTNRSRRGNPTFGFNTRRQERDPGQQGLEVEEGRLWERERADLRLREVEEERARERRAADREAELDHARRMNDLLRERVELQARVQAGPSVPLPAPAQDRGGPPPNAPTGPRAMTRSSPLVGEPRVHKGQQRSPASSLANRQRSVSRGLASGSRAGWVERDPATVRQPRASTSGRSAAAVFFEGSSAAQPRRKDEGPHEGR